MLRSVLGARGIKYENPGENWIVESFRVFNLHQTSIEGVSYSKHGANENAYNFMDDKSERKHKTLKTYMLMWANC
jgi:hypothetical protein